MQIEHGFGFRAPFELIIFDVSVQKVIDDVIKGKFTQLNRIHNLISKYTDRTGDDYLGGF